MQDVPYQIETPREVQVNRRQFDALALEYERKKALAKYVERHAQRPMILPSEHLHASRITAQTIRTSGYRSPGYYSQRLTAQLSGMEPSMIVTQPRPYPDTSSDSGRHAKRGAIPAAVLGVGAALVLYAVVLLPLWAIVLATVVLAIAVYVGVLTADVCRTMIPASEVEQRKIDWIVNRELPPLPDRYTCLDCGRFPEDCVCDDEPRKPKTEPCPGAVQMMGDPSNDCHMCGFPVHDH